MATKKPASSSKKATTKKSVATKPKTSTKVTTVKAVEARSAVAPSARFSFTRSPILTAAIAEFIGTFLLAAAFVAGQGQPISVLFALVGIVLIIGAISGAHVNPVVTVGAWATKKITSARAVTYLVAQVLGAMLALVVLSAYVNAAPAVDEQAAMFGQSAANLFTSTPLPEGKEVAVLFAELLGATIFAFAYASVLREKRERISAAFTIGLGMFIGLAIAGSAAIYVGGAAILNPAVAITAQAFNDANLWAYAVYGLVPLVGGVLGFLLNGLLRTNEDVTPLEHSATRL